MRVDMATVITYDEVGFIGQVLKVNGRVVCVLPSSTATDPDTQTLVRRLMHGEGIDCQACGGCPVGQVQ